MDVKRFIHTGGISFFVDPDNGENWIQTSYAGSDITSISIETGGIIFLGTDGGVYRSTNNGSNWNQVNNGLANTSVNSLAINSSNYIFAGTEGGVYYSIRNGDDWDSITHDLPTNSIKSLAINSSERYLCWNLEGCFIPATMECIGVGKIKVYLIQISFLSDKCKWSYLWRNLG